MDRPDGAGEGGWGTHPPAQDKPGRGRGKQQQRDPAAPEQHHGGEQRQASDADPSPPQGGQESGRGEDGPDDAGGRAAVPQAHEVPYPVRVEVARPPRTRGHHHGGDKLCADQRHGVAAGTEAPLGEQPEGQEGKRAPDVGSEAGRPERRQQQR